MWWKRNLPPLNPLWINTFVKCHCVHYGCYNTLVQIEWRKSTEMHSLAVLETRCLKPRCWKGYTPLEVSREDQFLFLPASCGSKCSLTCGHCCCSITKSCLTLWDPMCCSTPGFPVLLYIPEFAQTHVYWVSNTIQLFHPLSPPCPTALHFFHPEGPFQWVGFLHQMAKVLELQLQHHLDLWLHYFNLCLQYV